MTNPISTTKLGMLLSLVIATAACVAYHHYTSEVVMLEADQHEAVGAAWDRAWENVRQREEMPW